MTEVVREYRAWHEMAPRAKMLNRASLAYVTFGRYMLGGLFGFMLSSIFGLRPNAPIVAVVIGLIVLLVGMVVARLLHTTAKADFTLRLAEGERIDDFKMERSLNGVTWLVKASE